MMSMTDAFLPKTFVRFYLQIGSASLGFPSFSFAVKTSESESDSVTTMIIPDIEAELFEVGRSVGRSVGGFRCFLFPSLLLAHP